MQNDTQQHDFLDHSTTQKHSISYNNSYTQHYHQDNKQTHGNKNSLLSSIKDNSSYYLMTQTSDQVQKLQSQSKTDNNLLPSIHTIHNNSPLFHMPCDNMQRANNFSTTQKSLIELDSNFGRQCYQNIQQTHGREFFMNEVDTSDKRFDHIRQYLGKNIDDEKTRKIVIEAIISYIIEKGNDINAPNKNGFTPLHEALYYLVASRNTKYGIETIRILINMGAKRNIFNNKDETPLKYYKRLCKERSSIKSPNLEDTEVIDLLEDHQLENHFQQAEKRRRIEFCSNQDRNNDIGL